jgi:hypothetical protein
MADLTDLDVQEMKKFLDEICADLKRWLPEPQWHPAWQSEAAREYANDESGPDGPWGELPVRAAYLASALFLEAVLQCLRAMSAALTVETTPYVLYCLDRAAMEAGGQALWLLEAGIGARRRVTRWMLIRASGAQKLAEAVSETDPDSAGLYGETPERVDNEAARLGLQLEYRPRGRYGGDWGLRGGEAAGLHRTEQDAGGRDADPGRVQDLLGRSTRRVARHHR